MNFLKCQGNIRIHLKNSIYIYISICIVFVVNLFKKEYSVATESVVTEYSIKSTSIIIRFH